MTREELLAIEICKIARESKEYVDIMVAADALQEAGDIRTNAIRNHAKCCARGYNIIKWIANRYHIIKDMSEFYNEQITHADTWDCI
jgi:hypothetical protein